LPKTAIGKNEGIRLMGQINTTNLPDYLPEARRAETKVDINNVPQTSVPQTSVPQTSAPQASALQDDSQLTKLSSVLNSSKKGASAMRSQLSPVVTKVQSGTYEVDPLQVSRRIVGESLASR
jgi:hypothetical protein